MKKKVFVSTIFIFLLSVFVVVFVLYKFSVGFFEKNNNTIDVISECYLDSECIPEKPLVGIRYLCEFGNCVKRSLGNPASTRCQEVGGRVDIRKSVVDNSEYGVCVFIDGSECEEWRFLHQTCSLGDFYPSDKDSWSGTVVQPFIASDDYYFELLNGDIVGIVSDDTNIFGVLTALKNRGNIITISGDILDVIDSKIDKKINVVDIIDLGDTEFSKVDEGNSIDLAKKAIDNGDYSDITLIKSTKINCPYCWEFRFSYSVDGSKKFVDVIIQEGEIRDIEDVDGFVFNDCKEFSMVDMCIAQYDPVCGKIQKKNIVGNNLESSKYVRWETFPNSCVACTFDDTDEIIVGYEVGECVKIIN